MTIVHTGRLAVMERDLRELSPEMLRILAAHIAAEQNRRTREESR